MNKIILSALKQILKILIKCFVALADKNKDGKIQIEELKELFGKVKKKVSKKKTSKKKK